MTADFTNLHTSPSLAVTTSASLHEVKVGQVWADNDTRAAGRTLRVESIVTDPAPRHSVAVCRVLTPANGGINKKSGHMVRIALRRFRPNSTGYRLLISKGV